MQTIIIQCKSCGGTGLYQGMGETDGAAVVCHTCKGTGKTEFTYKEFTGKKVKEGVERVYKGSFGYCIGTKDITTDKGQLIRFSKFGCTYQEWLNGKTPRYIEDLQCPYICENRGMGNEPCSRCKEGCQSFGSISNCTFYSDKAKCWEEYNEKNGIEVD